MTVMLSGPPPRRRELDQLLDGLLGALVAGEGVLDRLVGDDPGEPVGADQVAVAGPDLADGEVGLDVVAAAQRAHQQERCGWVVRLLLGDAALVDQALHPGVVLGDLGEDAVAQQVGAGVADVDQAQALAGPQQGGERGAHALQWRVLLDHVRSWSLARWTAVPREVRTSEPGTSSSRATSGGDHLGGGDLTGGLAAHAVGDGEQARTGVSGVLVALPDHAFVGSGGEAQ